MGTVRFGACEFSFPCWGSVAMKMASEAGFQGMQIADAGGYLQPHPGNNGYVEYERYGLDLRRKDSFPLLFREVQEEYLAAAEEYEIELTSVYLYTLEHQGFIKYSADTPQGAQCRESLLNGIRAAAQMKIPTVTVAAKGMFGLAQNDYALQSLRYAGQMAAEYGVRLAVRSDLVPEKQIELVDALGDQVKLAFDAYAPLVYGTGDPVQQMKAASVQRIDHIRLRDCTTDGEGFVASFDSGAALLGQGKAPFRNTVQAVKDMDYTGWIIADTPYYHPDIKAAGESYASAAAKDIAALRTAFGMR